MMQNSPKPMKSSALRAVFKETCKTVGKSRIDVDITTGTKVVARLTTKEPETGTPPMFLKTDEFVKHFADGLDHVFNTNSRYYFRFRNNPGVDSDAEEDLTYTKVYLVRPPNSRNHFAQPWNEHRAEYQVNNQVNEPSNGELLDTMASIKSDIESDLSAMKETLEESVEHILRKLGPVVFAYIQRNGNLDATPEKGYPRRSVDDFDPSGE